MKGLTNSIYGLIFILIVFLLFACKSDEESKITSVKAPSVSSVYPEDDSADISTNANISVTFDETMDPSFVSSNTTDTNCSQAIQISSDDFANCVVLSTPVSQKPFTQFYLSAASGLQQNTTYKIKVTRQARDHAGDQLSGEYITPNGFTTGTSTGHLYGTAIYGTATYGD